MNSRIKLGGLSTQIQYCVKMKTRLMCYLIGIPLTMLNGDIDEIPPQRKATLPLLIALDTSICYINRVGLGVCLCGRVGAGLGMWVCGWTLIAKFCVFSQY
jgi:hypothetical protein